MRRILCLPLLIAAVTAVVGLLPAGAAAATCPPGQMGTPPYCQNEPPKTTPPAVVSTGNEVSGAVKVTLSVPGPGTVKLQGKAIKGITVKVGANGKVTVTLKPTGKVLQHLTNKGWTRRKRIKVTFIGADGSRQTVTIVVRFRKP